MELITTHDWATVHLGLIFLITAAYLIVLYLLNGDGNPVAGLGLYTVYVMAALLGWMAYTLEQVADIPMTVDVPAVAAIINSYILFLASGVRVDSRAGRLLLGAVCVGACLSVFFLPSGQMFLVQNAVAGLFMTCAGILAVRRAVSKNNVGDGIIALGASLMTLGVPVVLYQAWVAGQTAEPATIAFAAHSWAYVLVVIGFLASVVIEYQQQLIRLNTQDPMTRLHNRRGLENALQTTMAQAARQQLNTSAIMLDIDGFKEINSNFGHEYGDQVIRRVADLLRQLSRGSDVIARTDGEEFLLVLPHTALPGAKVIAERIRACIAEEAILINAQSIPITVSVGVACIVGDEGLDKLSQDAERAMYLAKRSGNNRVGSVESKTVHLRSRQASTD